jgi:EAL domain-containing protein (putative c-di-GMP-specific phosphodiesterase class I)
VESTVDLAHRLGLRIVAEGVETEVSASRLRDLGCDLAQGFHFGRPESAQAFSTRLARSRARRRLRVVQTTGRRAAAGGTRGSQ